MISRPAVLGQFRLGFHVLAVIAGLAMLAFSVQLALAGQGNVTITKTTDAVEPVLPGSPNGSYSYTITATVGSLPVTNLIVQDTTLDFPQVAVTAATYTLNGVGPLPCDPDGPSDVVCSVGVAPASAIVVLTIDVTVNPDVQIACDDPNNTIPVDDTIRNTATAQWNDADSPAPGTPWSVTSSPTTVVNLDCSAYVPDPDTTITAGPAQGSSTTSTSASFTFTGTNTPTSFQCKLDSGVYAVCTSPKDYTGLAVGSHTFSVRAIGPGGTDLTPATRTWTITSTPPPPPPPPDGHPFTDINGHPFENDIIWLYNAGITGGCTSTRFCPDSSVLRDQMASFLDRALDLPATAIDFYDDDDGNIHEGAINRLAQAGITGGCDVRRYCPKDSVKRDQMASFLVRAFTLTPTATDYFNDDEGNIHENQINALAASGITGGCGPGRYCPTNLVSRGQMAAFLNRAMN